MLCLADLGSGELDATALDDQERRRMARLQRAADREAFLASHLLLRQLLSRELGCEPHEISFTRERCPRCGAPNGRPAVAQSTPSLHFSISRDGGLVLVALAQAPVGVDIQALADRELGAEVRTLLHRSEREQILSTPAAGQPAAFARIWTRKEAYLKGIGTGVAHGMEANNLGTDHATAALGWSVVDLPVAAGYAAALALKL
jgi:4'-phosphopantetheinyl transferase